jgi:hypothetical protein
LLGEKVSERLPTLLVLAFDFFEREICAAEDKFQVPLEQTPPQAASL